MPRLLVCWGLLALGPLWSAIAEAKELTWRSVDVDARIDGDGALRIRERHAVVLTGDWNGLTRQFRVGAREWMRLEGVVRIEAEEEETALIGGDLDLVGRYQWLPEEHLLRWRVRGPLDPGFDHAELEYRIDYVLSGALRPEPDGSYGLSHDFAFDRPGEIERFRVRLALDEAWSTSRPVPIELTRDRVRPGESVELALSLRYDGAELPALLRPPRSSVGPAAPEPSSAARLWHDGRLWAAALFALLVAGLVALLFARSRKLGHFEALPRQETIDRRWIEEHVLVLKPEVVGAAYDRHSGKAEVAALLARLEQEDKVASRRVQAEGGPARLELTLCVARGELQGYERALIEKLFVAGERTSAAALRQHYQHFDPARVLARPLADELRALLGPRAGSDEGLAPASVALLAVSAWALHSSIVRVVLEWSGWWRRDGLQVVTALGLFACVGCGGFLASVFRQQPQATDGDPTLRGGSRSSRCW